MRRNQLGEETGKEGTNQGSIACAGAPTWERTWLVGKYPTDEGTGAPGEPGEEGAKSGRACDPTYHLQSYSILGEVEQEQKLGIGWEALVVIQETGVRMDRSERIQDIFWRKKQQDLLDDQIWIHRS